MPLPVLFLPAVPQLLYDGVEDAWVSRPWPLPQPDGTTFLAHLSRDVQPLEKLMECVRAADFQQLLREVRGTARDWSGHGDWVYKGYDGLPLCYVRHGRQLWVLAAGEYQPARYKTWLHGSWRLNQSPEIV